MFYARLDSTRLRMALLWDVGVDIMSTIKVLPQ
ncbi:uncharacterized protein LOC114841609 [Diachasma alloeum]|uniref:Odorant binding protein n=1 Tax=Diachasma alloeum TaxID=454923 RepID=A0A4E0RM60_9HYME|nr:uncharacterized protein LOC114841609 [Diachasma alloeum]THK33229.1 odorant binding protein [Diachasma alloeum]